MNPLSKFINTFKKKSLADDISNNTLFGWHPTGGSTLDFYRDNQYDNGYGSITKIVNAFMDIKPYTVNEKGDKVKSNLYNRLYHPNQDMSSNKFREALAVMTLVHNRVFILCWRTEDGQSLPGGEIKPDNLAGFTFLENPVVSNVNNEKIYTYNGNTYTDKEVIELKDVNPYNLSRGYSPAEAARKWATIDDYIAAYQGGFFKNGAVPAGQFIVTASTVTEFNDEVDRLEAKHKGAGKNNNIVYVHRPVTNDGKPSNAKIEWIPFNITNKDLDFGTLFKNVNEKIDSVYGVPAEIRGFLSNSNYASVATAERIFVKYVVKPFTTKLWTEFTHQLNRITGGLGVGISFELEIPGLADEELVIEETKDIRDKRFIALKDAGYTLASIKKYFETEDLLSLEKEVVTEDDNGDVDEGDEVEDSPDSSDGSGDGTLKTVKEGVHTLKAKQLSEEERTNYEQRLYDVAFKQMAQQIDRAVNETSEKAIGDPTDEELQQFLSSMMLVIVDVMRRSGAIQNIEGIGLLNDLGIDTDDVSGFRLTQQIVEDYRNYLTNVAQSYTNDTAEAIRTTLAEGLEEGLTRAEIERDLRGLLGRDEYRVRRLSVSEVNRSSQRASLDAMEQIENDADVELYKVWNVSNLETCPYCEELDGTAVRVTDTFLPVGGEFIGTDGSTRINNFVSVETAQAHPSCYCYLTYEVR